MCSCCYRIFGARKQQDCCLHAPAAGVTCHHGSDCAHKAGSPQAAGNSATWSTQSAHSLKQEPQATPCPTRQNTERSMLQPCTLQVSVCGVVPCVAQTTYHDTISPHSSPTHAPSGHTQHTPQQQISCDGRITRSRPKDQLTRSCRMKPRAR
jgi:hypothetical protein